MLEVAAGAAHSDLSASKVIDVVQRFGAPSGDHNLPDVCQQRPRELQHFFALLRNREICGNQVRVAVHHRRNQLIAIHRNSHDIHLDVLEAQRFIDVRFEALQQLPGRATRSAILVIELVTAKRYDGPDHPALDHAFPIANPWLPDGAKWHGQALSGGKHFARFIDLTVVVGIRRHLTVRADLRRQLRRFCGCLMRSNMIGREGSHRQSQNP